MVKKSTECLVGKVLERVLVMAIYQTFEIDDVIRIQSDYLFRLEVYERTW